MLDLLASSDDIAFQRKDTWRIPINSTANCEIRSHMQCEETMQIRSCALAMAVFLSGPAYSQETETYLLTVPISLGENLSHELCSRAMDIPDDFCHVETMAVPGSNEALTITYYSAAGSFDDIFANPVADFVPWPWSSFPAGPSDLDFG